MSTILKIKEYLIEVSGNLPLDRFYTTPNKSFIAYPLHSKNNTTTLIYKGSPSVNDQLVKSDFTVRSSLDFFGEVIDVFGDFVVNSSKKVKSYIQHSSPIFNTAANLTQRKNLTTPLQTGIHAIDIFNPIGLGQREVIVGDSQTGKTHIALNTIINQTTVKSIYVLIGKKEEDLKYIYNSLKQNNTLENTIIINADFNNPLEIYLAPYIAMSHAENLAHTHDVLIVFDDLDNHANILRGIATIDDQPIAREGFPPDLFYMYSRLLERSGSFVDKKTITALPIITSIEGDITNFLITYVMSITDGQIITSKEMFNSNLRPAINISRSVSRTGSAVQPKAIQSVSKKMISLYDKYQKTKIYQNTDYELNRETTKINQIGRNIEDFLTQHGFHKYDEEKILLSTKMILTNILKKLDTKLMTSYLKFILTKDHYGKQIANQIENNISLDLSLFGDYILNMLNHIGYNFKINQAFPRPELTILQHLQKIQQNYKG